MHYCLGLAFINVKITQSEYLNNKIKAFKINLKKI